MSAPSSYFTLRICKKISEKSVGYEEKEKGQTLNFEDLSTVAPELGLEPRTL